MIWKWAKGLYCDKVKDYFKRSCNSVNYDYSFKLDHRKTRYSVLVRNLSIFRLYFLNNQINSSSSFMWCAFCLLGNIILHESWIIYVHGINTCFSLKQISSSSASFTLEKISQYSFINKIFLMVLVFSDSPWLARNFKNVQNETTQHILQ